MAAPVGLLLADLWKLTQRSGTEHDPSTDSELDVGLRLRGGSSLMDVVAQSTMEMNQQDEFGAQPNESPEPQLFMSPYDIPRSQLLEQLGRMRTVLLDTLARHEAEDLQTNVEEPEQLLTYEEEAEQLQTNYEDFFSESAQYALESSVSDREDESLATPKTAPLNKPGNKRRIDDDNGVRCPGASKKRRTSSPPRQDGAHHTPPVTPPPDTSPQLAADVESNDGSLEDRVSGETESDPRKTGSPEYQENMAATHPKGCQNRLEVEEEEESGRCRGVEGAPARGLSPQRRSPPARPLPAVLKGVAGGRSLGMNGKLSALILQEIRKPGKDYKKIFYFLKQIEGSAETKLLFLQGVIREAARFKKNFLVKELENCLTEFRSSSDNVIT